MGVAVVKHIQVLMACYNGEQYLPKQLDSLRAQDDPSFSVLMQDDGSTDLTPILLSRVVSEDRRFHPAASRGQRYGAIGNFLSLMKQSTGDYVALCDQDDEWSKRRLSRCRTAMEEAEARYGEDTPLLVHSDCRVVSSKGEPIHHSFFRHQGWDKHAVTLNRLLVQNNVTGCTTLMNAALRDLVVAHAKTEDLYMHDWFIALTAAAFGHVVFVNEQLVDYRQHGVNVMGASEFGLGSRGLKALSRSEKAHARITLTYTNTRAFRDAYGDALPEAASKVIQAYLETEQMPRMKRVLAVQRMGCTMQSVITRMGQLFFG